MVNRENLEFFLWVLSHSVPMNCPTVIQSNTKVCFLCVFQWQKQCVRLSVMATVLGPTLMSAATQSVLEAALDQETQTALWVPAPLPLYSNCSRSATSIVRGKYNENKTKHYNKLFTGFWLWYSPNRPVDMSITQAPASLTALGPWCTTDRPFSWSPTLKPCISTVPSAYPNVPVSYKPIYSVYYRGAFC